MPIPRASLRTRKNTNRIVFSAGDRFGKLVIERQATAGEMLWYKHFRPSKHTDTIFMCRCNCGNRKLAKMKDLRRGHAKSCGCGQFGNHKYLPGVGVLNGLFGACKRNAAKRGISFSLSKDEFKSIISQNCTYCGKIPTERKVKGNIGSLLANGIDRVDSNLGYDKENCVPCCYRCNIAKSDSSLEDFRSWVFNVVAHLSREK